VAANVLCLQYKTKQLINVCRKNTNNRIDEKKKKSSYKLKQGSPFFTSSHVVTADLYPVQSRNVANKTTNLTSTRITSEEFESNISSPLL
jgi:hypothetical protein